VCGLCYAWDEATSALDTKTEAGIMDTLGYLMSGRTTILIAHRLSTAMTCDQIAVLEGGQIVEQGSHQQLLAAEGRYAGMWAAQAHGGGNGTGTPGARDSDAMTGIESQNGSVERGENIGAVDGEHIGPVVDTLKV
jgi:ABC-type multidrug transport system ATPase subunit